jgi:hypothetical protein
VGSWVEEAIFLRFWVRTMVAGVLVLMVFLVWCFLYGVSCMVFLVVSIFLGYEFGVRAKESCRYLLICGALEMYM